MLIEYLDSSLKALCPILGLSIPDLQDSTSWRIDFHPEATESQKQAALNFIASFSLVTYEKQTLYIEQRVSAYPPIGDQLDALLKQLNSMQIAGQIQLVPDLAVIINKWQDVKTMYPKPSESK